MTRARSQSPIAYYGFPVAIACAVASIALFGSRGLVVGVTMCWLGAIVLLEGLAMTFNWRAATEEIHRRLGSDESSPLRLAPVWILRLVGIGLSVIASMLLVAGAHAIG